MKEYIKYSSDYLLLKLKHYIHLKEDFSETREKVAGKSFIAYLALTQHLKTIQNRINSITSILTHRNYSIEEINSELDKLPSA